MKAFISILCSSFIFLNGCADDASMVPPNFTAKADASSLSYSGVVVLGSTLIPWTNKSGMLIFTVVRNHSDADWEGYPEAAVYSINADATRGELIGVDQGVLTSHVDRINLTPTDELHRVPANGEREALTFVSVDFNVHPRVYVYWKFVDSKDETMVFQNSIANPTAQHHFSLPEAKAILQSTE